MAIKPSESDPVGGLRTGWCDDCGTATYRVPRRDGLLVELEQQPHPEGTVVLTRELRSGVVAHVLTRQSLTRTTRTRWMPHRAICPADTERRRVVGGSRVLLSGFGCLGVGCRAPMPVALLEIGELAHPTCELPPGLAVTLRPYRRTA